jgi:hypothetical protein
MYSFLVDQEINSIWSEDCRGTYRLYSMNAYYSLLGEIVIISPVNRSFQEHQKFNKPWSTLKGHSFPQRFSVVQKSTPFPHGTEHTQSVWLKAVTQSEFKSWMYILKISEFQIEVQKSHTHTNTKTHTYTHTRFWYSVLYLVRKFLNSLYWIKCWTDEKSLNARTPLCTPSIPAIQMWGFLSRILMHT